jgi:hypothetical protein
MKPATKAVVAVLAATLWISVNEFVRNEFLVKDHWTAHYRSLGMTFPSAPVNGAIWGLWSLLFALSILIISRPFDLLRTTALAWLVGFGLMWVVLGNLGVLPFGILPYAVPLSLLEAFGAAWIVKRIT